MQKLNTTTISPSMLPARFVGIIRKISETAEEHGYDAYAVGGFTRDIILGREPKDLDVMVDKNGAITPGIEFAKLLAQKYALNELEVFEKFGTARLVIDGEPVEFIMPRKEYYMDNSRKPETEIGSLKQDAMRRDFTINALFLRLNQNQPESLEILDLTESGIADLKNKIIRVTDTSNADVIFTQDPLRILRAVRQSMQFDFEIGPLTKVAMTRAAKTIRKISTERIREELETILAGDKPSCAFRTLDEINLLHEILPETEGSKSGQGFGKMLKTLDNTAPDNLILRIAALFSETRDIHTAEVALKRLHFDNSLIRNVIVILKHQHITCGNKMLSDADIRRLALDTGSQFENILDLAEARSTCEQIASVRSGMAHCRTANPGCPAVINTEHFATTDSQDWLSYTNIPERCGLNNNTTCEIIRRVEDLKAKGELYITGEVLTGQEIMKHFGLPPGKEVARMKDLIREVQLENPHISKDEALELIEVFKK